jgi:RNA polymerase sigma-70 factor (ECF subfamily)
LPLHRDEFRRLFEAHRDRVHQFAYRLCRNGHDADDIVQETFLRAWRKREQCRGEDSAAAWLRSIAFTVFVNGHARDRRRRALAPPPAPPAVAPDGADAVAEGEARRRLVDRVEQALSTLPAEQREAFVMFRFAGLTCPEIAELLAVSPRAVESRIRRATQSLQGAIARSSDPLEAHR